MSEEYDPDPHGFRFQFQVGEKPRGLPAELRELLSKPLLDVFKNPANFFDRIASSAKRNSIKRFFGQLNNNELCSLVLEMPLGIGMEPYAGICAFGSNSRVFVEPVGKDRADCSIEFFECIDSFCWTEPHHSGELFYPGYGPSLKQYGFELAESKLAGTRFSISETIVFGNTDCGDAMIVNPDGLAGFITHETFDNYEVGPIDELIDLVLDMLIAGEIPSFDWSQVNSQGN